MAEFESPPPRPPEYEPERDPPRRDVPYAPPERRFESAPRANMSDWTPRLAAIVVLAILIMGYVITAHRDQRPMGFPYSMVALVALAFVQWMPLQRTQSGKLLIALASIAGALLWLAASLIQI